MWLTQEWSARFCETLYDYRNVETKLQSWQKYNIANILSCIWYSIAFRYVITSEYTYFGDVVGAYFYTLNVFMILHVSLYSVTPLLF